MFALLTALVMVAVVDHTPDSQLAKTEPTKPPVKQKKEEDIPLKISRTFYKYKDAYDLSKKADKVLVVFIGDKPDEVNLSNKTLVCYANKLAPFESGVVVAKWVGDEFLAYPLKGEVTDANVKAEVDKILAYKAKATTQIQTQPLQYYPSWQNSITPQTCPTGKCPYKVN